MTTTVWCVPLVFGNDKSETITVRVMFFYGHLCSNFYCVNFRQITHIFRFLKARQGLVYEHFFAQEMTLPIETLGGVEAQTALNRDL